MKTILSWMGNVLLAGLLASFLAPFVDSVLDQRSYREQRKRDVFARFVGNRHYLAGACRGKSSAEPFIALNEMFVVFDDSPLVISTLNKLRQEIDQPGRDLDNMVTLIKEMARSSKIRLNNLNDDFFLTPFTPSRGCGRNNKDHVGTPHGFSAPEGDITALI